MLVEGTTEDAGWQAREFVTAVAWVTAVVVLSGVQAAAKRLIQALRRRQRRPGPPVAPRWANGERFFDDFEVVRPLGEGGMGAVMLVRSVSSGQQFALKRALPTTAGERRDLLAEISTWLNLPRHPHLAVCRFFTTVGEEVVLFAEYVEEGSLGDWIRSGRLPDVDAILEVAARIAWGLDAIHACDLVHRDVKPANVLMAAIDQPKLTDFGLTGYHTGAPGAGKTISAAGTAAYRSPEQLAGKKLTPASDQWSWGLTVLEMFIGEVTWGCGSLAADVLDDLLVRRPDQRGRHFLPVEVIAVLRRCFCEDPAARWPSLAHPAAELAVLHQARTRRSSPLAPPKPAPRSAGWEIAECAARASAAADIGRFARSLAHLDRLNAPHDRDARRFTLLLYKARAHADGHDFAGADATYEAAAALARRLLAATPSPARSADLAHALAGRGLANVRRGRFDMARQCFAASAKIREQLLAERYDDNLAFALAVALTHEAMAAQSVGEVEDAEDLLDRAIEWFAHPQAADTAERMNDLATAIMAKAVLLLERDNPSGAFSYFDKAVKIRESLVHHRGRRDMRSDLARAYANLATAWLTVGDAASALPLYRRAIEIRTTLDPAAQPGLRREFATVCLNAARAAETLGDISEAHALCQQAATPLEIAVHTLGMLELRGELAWAQLWEADLATRHHRGTTADTHTALEVLAAEAKRTGRTDLAQVLVWARQRFR